MGIDTAWITESNEPKQEVFDPQQCLTRLATSAWCKLNDSVCLRYIDPWGDSVFNQSQIPILLEELRVTSLAQRELEINAHLGKVIRLVERAVDQTHTYIKVIGD